MLSFHHNITSFLVEETSILLLNFSFLRLRAWILSLPKNLQYSLSYHKTRKLLVNFLKSLAAVLIAWDESFNISEHSNLIFSFFISNKEIVISPEFWRKPRYILWRKKNIFLVEQQSPKTFLITWGACENIIKITSNMELSFWE